MRSAEGEPEREVRCWSAVDVGDCSREVRGFVKVFGGDAREVRELFPSVMPDP